MHRSREHAGSRPPLVRVSFGSGIDLLRAYWNAVGTGGLLLRAAPPVPDGAPVRLRVRIGAGRAVEAAARVAARLPPRPGHPARTAVEFASVQDAAPLLEQAWKDAPDYRPRRFLRLPLARLVVYGAGDERAHGLTHDLGLGGLCLSGPRPYPRHAKVHVTFGGLRLLAEVRWLEPGPLARLGLAFLPAPGAREAVAGLLAACPRGHAGDRGGATIDP